MTVSIKGSIKGSIKQAARKLAHRVGFGYRVEVVRWRCAAQRYQTQVTYCWSWQGALEWKAAMIGSGWEFAVVSVSRGRAQVASQELIAGA